VTGEGPVAYDALVLALGARAFVPPVPGADLPGVQVLRTLSDALALRDRPADAGPVVVAGGGLLGLEAAASLRGAGRDVTVVEMAPWLLPRQVDRGGAEVLREVLSRRGLRFRLGTQVARIAGAGRVDGVELGTGERLPAAIVLFAAGVRPDVDLAKAAGLAVGRAIVVDDALRTSAPGVWAAGDCAEHRGRTPCLWISAEAQGKAAGASVAGAEVAFEGIVPQATLKVADLLVWSIGDPSAWDPDRGVAARDGDAWRRLASDADGRLIGAVLIGNLRERRAVAAAVAAGTPLAGAGGAT
jgi:NAD(P)H-nitrite reductase large subunit